MGAVSRYLATGWVQDLTGDSFPWGTFLVNVAGSLVLGFSMVWLQSAVSSADLRQFIAIGFLAPFAVERVRRVGNAALDGARQLLLDVGRRERVERLVARIEHIELETTEDFFDVFTEACQFKPMQLG